MNKLVTVAVALWCFLPTKNEATAGLINRGNGLIYDDELNVTWLQNADLFSTGVSAQSWAQAVALVASLNYQGFGDWRLPTTPGSNTGFLNEGELGHLYYTGLGNVQGGSGFNAGPFINIQRGRYWTATSSGVDSAFTFFVAEDAVISGLQDTDQKNHGNNIWALRDGDVVPIAVPESSPILLFSVGVAGLAWSRSSPTKVRDRR
jgi:hypothetical protein